MSEKEIKFSLSEKEVASWTVGTAISVAQSLMRESHVEIAWRALSSRGINTWSALWDCVISLQDEKIRAGGVESQSQEAGVERLGLLAGAEFAWLCHSDFPNPVSRCLRDFFGLKSAAFCRGFIDGAGVDKVKGWAAELVAQSQTPGLSYQRCNNWATVFMVSPKTLAACLEEDWNSGAQRLGLSRQHGVERSGLLSLCSLADPAPFIQAVLFLESKMELTPNWLTETEGLAPNEIPLTCLERAIATEARLPALWMLERRPEASAAKAAQSLNKKISEGSGLFALNRQGQSMRVKRVAYAEGLDLEVATRAGPFAASKRRRL